MLLAYTFSCTGPSLLEPLLREYHYQPLEIVCVHVCVRQHSQVARASV